jgi:hypothetical protein
VEDKSTNVVQSRAPVEKRRNRGQKKVTSVAASAQNGDTLQIDIDIEEDT